MCSHKNAINLQISNPHPASIPSGKKPDCYSLIYCMVEANSYFQKDKYS